MKEEKLILVDSEDTVIGEMEKMHVHEKGFLHRAFSIFIFRHTVSGLELLMQRRAFNKYHSSGLWANSCCGHPRPGEITKNAAIRRLGEELGLVIDLEKIGNLLYKKQVTNNLIEHEYDHIYIGFWQGEKIFPHPNEVYEIGWWSIKEIQNRLISNEQLFAAWFIDAFNIVIKSIKNEKN